MCIVKRCRSEDENRLCAGYLSSLSETFIAREIEALRRCGFTIEIFALQAGQGAHPLETGGAALNRAVRGLDTVRSGRDAAFSRLGVRWWNSVQSQFRFDWIHGGFASHPADIAWGAARAAGLPWSFSGHARDIFVDNTAVARKIEAARFVSVCTRAGQEHLQRLAPSQTEKILYVPHGLPLAHFPFRDVELSASRALLSVGRLVEKKGFWCCCKRYRFCARTSTRSRQRSLARGRSAASWKA
jgi:glycosyltransferase involved in cell wall biosynthesis